jgi:hypothetical protein
MLEAASRISSFAWLVLTIACALAADTSGQMPMGGDSLQLQVQWAAMSDSLLPRLEMELEADGQSFHPADSIGISLLKGSSISVWARFDGGRLQFDHSLSRFKDTVSCVLGCDMLGCVLTVDQDTLRFLWSPAGTGCFPAVRNHEVERVVRDALSEPFESKRLARLQPWIKEQCLTLEQLRRCAAAFDDEERKLKLLRDASCSTPSYLHELGTVFASQRYRDRFLEWVQSHR